jgi:hypothetical protein
MATDLYLMHAIRRIQHPSKVPRDRSTVVGLLLSLLSLLLLLQPCEGISELLRGNKQISNQLPSPMRRQYFYRTKRLAEMLEDQRWQKATTKTLRRCPQGYCKGIGMSNVG